MRCAKTLLRFWKKVDKSADCWVWAASKNKNGYGSFGFNGKVCLAHRVSWMLFNGEIPDGMFVLHKCDNPSCVRPSHLMIGDHKMNMSHMMIKNRQTFGERNPNSKLKEKQVMEILNDNRICRLIAADYGVSDNAIHDIKNRDSWKHLEWNN